MHQLKHSRISRHHQKYINARTVNRQTVTDLQPNQQFNCEILRIVFFCDSSLGIARLLVDMFCSLSPPPTLCAHRPLGALPEKKPFRTCDTGSKPPPPNDSELVRELRGPRQPPTYHCWHRHSQPSAKCTRPLEEDLPFQTTEWQTMPSKTQMPQQHPLAFSCSLFFFFFFLFICTVHRFKAKVAKNRARTCIL